MEIKTLSARALEIALAQLGVQEHPIGSNDGPEVRKYLASVGLPPGNAWCMAGVYFCVDQACKELGLVNPLVKTGSVKTQVEKTTLRKFPNSSTAVKAGDLFYQLHADGSGHIGFVVAAGSPLFKDYSGNTNQNGGREGFEWAFHARPRTSYAGFIQLP